MLHYYSTPDDPNRISFAGEYNEGILRIAAARTSNKDVFVRKVGRKKAEGRLKDNILVFENNVGDSTIKKFVEVCKDITPLLHKDPFAVSFKL
jgi:hypothetical protein